MAYSIEGTQTQRGPNDNILVITAATTNGTNVTAYTYTPTSNSAQIINIYAIGVNTSTFAFCYGITYTVANSNNAGTNTLGTAASTVSQVGPTAASLDVAVSGATLLIRVNSGNTRNLDWTIKIEIINVQ